MILYDNARSDDAYNVCIDYGSIIILTISQTRIDNLCILFLFFTVHTVRIKIIIIYNKNEKQGD